MSLSAGPPVAASAPIAAIADETPAKASATPAARWTAATRSTRGGATAVFEVRLGLGECKQGLRLIPVDVTDYIHVPGPVDAVLLLVDPAHQRCGVVEGK